MLGSDLHLNGIRIPMTGSGSFVGFGFGPIQAGLFLVEAQRSGNFRTFAVAEVDPQLVALVRANSGTYTVNIARAAGVDAARVGPVEILNPQVPADRDRLVDHLSVADEAATAVPSVACYGGGTGSVAWMIARGLAARTAASPLIIYAAENHNHAAEILAEKVTEHGSPAGARAEFLNTVVGKMSGVVRGRTELRELGLQPLIPGADRAFLVEEFNRILVNRPARGTRMIDVFLDKADLLPFEEAKLYGHNAAHGLLAFLAQELGLRRIPEAGRQQGLLPFVRDAFVHEAGAALVKKYGGLDPLFSPAGFAAYADDLLDRMTRTSLNDAVERVARDPERKLAYEDRFFGTIRLCRRFSTGGDRFAFGAACAFARLRPDAGPTAEVGRELARLWGRDDEELAPSVQRAWRRFHAWRQRGRPDLVAFWQEELPLTAQPGATTPAARSSSAERSSTQ